LGKPKHYRIFLVYRGKAQDFGFKLTEKIRFSLIDFPHFKQEF